MTAALSAGDRIELTEKVAPMLRPRGARTGEVVADAGDCWKVRFDGTKSTRRIFKPYVQREANNNQ